MRVRETSGIVVGGQTHEGSQSIYMSFMLLRMYGCQYDAWKGEH
jgi:hypothetical protein